MSCLPPEGRSALAPAIRVLPRADDQAAPLHGSPRKVGDSKHDLLDRDHAEGPTMSSDEIIMRRCPPTMAVKRIYGRADARIDQIRMVCEGVDAPPPEECRGSARHQ